MKILREIKKVTNNKVLINLPDNFSADRVEIIVVPILNKKRKNRSKLRDLLLNGPTFSKKEIEDFKNPGLWMRKWGLKKF